MQKEQGKPAQQQPQSGQGRVSQVSQGEKQGAGADISDVDQQEGEMNNGETGLDEQLDTAEES